MNIVIYGTTIDKTKEKLSELLSIHNEKTLSKQSSKYGDFVKLENDITYRTYVCLESCKAVKWDLVYVDSTIDKDIFYKVIYYNGTKGCADIIFY